MSNKIIDGGSNPLAIYQLKELLLKHTQVDSIDFASWYVSQTLIRKQMKKLLSTSILASALLFTGCYFPTSIDSGEVGVIKSWGEVSDSPITAGLTFSLVPGDDLYVMKVKNKQAVFTNSEITEDKRNADTAYTSAITVLTEQQLPIPLDVSMLYQLDPKRAPEMMKSYGEDGLWDDKLVVRTARAIVRDTIGQTSLEKLNSNRASYEETIRVKLNAALSKTGVTITQFNVQNIGVPQAIQESVMAKEQAKQAAEKAKYQVEQAKAEAEVEIAKAEGVAKANNVLAGSLTDRLVTYKQLEIQRVQADKWNGAMPTVFSGSASPMSYLVNGTK